MTCDVCTACSEGKPSRQADDAPTSFAANEMQDQPELQRDGLGLPPLALQAVLQHISNKGRLALLRCSRSVRHDVLMCAETLVLTPGLKKRGQLSKQLRDVLQHRTEPLRLILNLGKGPKGQVSTTMADQAHKHKF